MRFKDRDQLFAREPFTGGVDGNRNLGRMMSIVIDKDVLAMLLNGEAAFCPLKRRQSGFDLFGGIALQQSQRNHAEAVP